MSELLPGGVLCSNGVRMDDAALRKLLDHLDASGVNATPHERRVYPRFTYRQIASIELRQPSGHVSVLKAPTRNLSRGGVEFLSQSYVHTGCRCRTELHSMYGEPLQIDGRVVRCQYVEHGVHTVAVQFDRQIDVTIFSVLAVSRRVLLVEDDVFARKLAEFHLRKLNAQVATAENGREALEILERDVFDVVFMDIEMPEMDGLTAMTELKKRGYSGPVVAMTAFSDAGDRERMLAAGFTQYLAKPFSREQVEGVLKRLDSQPLISSIATVEGAPEIINQFVEELAHRMTALEAAVAREQFDELASLARQLKGESHSCGFAPICQAAEQVESIVVRKLPVEQIKKHVLQLVRLCRMARPCK